MEASNAVSTPGEVGTRATAMHVQSSREGISTKPYRELIESLLATAARPDIAYIVSYLAQFNHSYTEKHWGRLQSAC